MKNLVREKTSSTPDICFDASSGVMRMSGRSTPENPHEFYKEAMAWVENYLLDPSKKGTHIFFYFQYINTSSLKCLLELMKKIKPLMSVGDLSVEWLYDDGDDDMRELGADFAELLKIPFHLTISEREA
jgi:hypothetical protein